MGGPRREFEDRDTFTINKETYIMEKRAYDVLQRKLARITESNVDPAWLARNLLSAEIIGSIDVQRASNSREVTDGRLAELVDKVMRNGAPDVFQTFVSILLKYDAVKWLGKELKGMPH